MIQDLRGEHVGRRVLYHPEMPTLLASGCEPHRSLMWHGSPCEPGRVSSWNSSYVFVRFGGEDSTAQACRGDQLVWEDCPS